MCSFKACLVRSFLEPVLCVVFEPRARFASPARFALSWGLAGIIFFLRFLMQLMAKGRVNINIFELLILNVVENMFVFVYL